MNHMPSARFHLTLGGIRTTVTLDKLLSELLALKLGFEPDDARAHSAVRNWIQSQYDDGGKDAPMGPSKWIRFRAIQTVIDRSLWTAYATWEDKRT